MGLSPRCVIEIPEHGHGRIDRLQRLIGSCGSSIHDLSRVNMPVRFNMPFELGLACALQKVAPAHQIVVLERVPHRLQKTLSDYNGRDPIVHNGSRERLLLAILDVFDSTNAPPPAAVRRVLKLLSAATPAIKKTYRQETILTRGVFNQVVAIAGSLAVSEGVISAN